MQVNAGRGGVVSPVMMTMSRTSADPPDPWLSRVRAAQAGEGARRDRLLEDVRERLVVWARALTGDWDRAEDLAQEALLKVSRGLDGYRGDSFLGWSYRVLANCHRDQHRRLARRERMDAAHRHDLPAPGVLDHRDPSAVVRRYLGELTDQQRAVFQLVDLEGWSGADAAEALGIAAATARVHLHRARETLRAHILDNLP